MLKSWNLELAIKQIASTRLKNTGAITVPKTSFESEGKPFASSSRTE